MTKPQHNDATAGFGNARGEAPPERTLWQAVLLTALQDATSDSETRDAWLAKRDADRWLRQQGKDFKTVCLLAGFDPDHVYDAYTAGRVTFAEGSNGRMVMGKREAA